MISGLSVLRIDGVSLLASAGTTVTFPFSGFSGDRFLPLFVFGVIRTLTGPAISTSPVIRIGTNGAHNNVAPNFTIPPSVSVGTIGSMPLASPIQAPILRTSPLLAEIATAGVGPTSMLADLLVVGIAVGD